MNNNEIFERLAKQFHRETGLIAPGKDISPAVGNNPNNSLKHRMIAWNLWKAKKELARKEATTPEATK